MTSVVNLGINNTQTPTVVENVPKNVRRVNFKAESDSYIKSNNINTRPVYSPQVANMHEIQMQKMIEQQQKAEKKQKWKQNLSWGAGILSAAAIIAVAVISLKSMRGNPADESIIRKIKEKLANVKNPAIKQQVEAELRMNAHERNLYRAENLIKLDELAQDTAGRSKVPIDKLEENFRNGLIGVEEAKKELISGVKKSNYNIDHGIIDTKPTILILDGSPGTSKTTMAKLYADAAGLYYKKIPCGGISDAQSIIGFKRTYMGSVHGVIAEGQIESGTKEVCYCLDEIDRVTKKEILDALLSPFEENAIFVDQYYGVPIDLSRSTFVLTTNDFTRLPEALKNRATIVHIKDYTPKEKADIAELKLKMRIAKDKAEKYLTLDESANCRWKMPKLDDNGNLIFDENNNPIMEEITGTIYDYIASKTMDKGGRQVDLLTEEIMTTIKGMQQDGKIKDKIKIDQAFLDKIELGKNMQEAAKLELERAINPIVNV